MAYLGEKISVKPLLEEIHHTATERDFSVETLATFEGFPLLAMERLGQPDAPSIYVSAGIHGDEPAGPLALLELLKNDLPREISWTFCPMLNPVGLHLGTRENRACVDLNRDYLSQTQPETVAHVNWLQKRGGFNLALFLHEDWESSGFYIYELNLSDVAFSLARQMIEAARNSCPIDLGSKIDGHDAVEGIITPKANDLLREEWPEAFYIFNHHNRLNYTLESPSALALKTRVAALQAAVLAAAQEITYCQSPLP